MSTVSEKKTFMTTGEACQYLDVTQPTLRRWASELGIQAYPGSRNTVNYRVEDIERMKREKALPHLPEE